MAAYEPIAKAVLVLGGVQGAKTDTGALLLIARSLWVSPSWPSSVPTKPGGTINVVASDAETLRAIDESLSNGTEVVVGLSPPNPGDTTAFLEHATAIKGTDLILLGEGPLVERYRAILSAFVSSASNPFLGMDLESLLARWSEEAEGKPSDRTPLRAAWASFVEHEVIAPGDYEGTVGTQQYWDASPPQCRDIADAPASVLKTLVPVDVWFQVPPEWRALRDGVLCLNTDLASLGCTDLETFGAFGYVDLSEGAVSPGEAISVTVARNTTNGPSWLDRVAIGTIAWPALGEDQAALVVLDADDARPSFDELRETPPQHTSTRALSRSDVEALLEQAAASYQPVKE